MLAVAVSACFALCATTIFAFRFSAWGEPARLARYFVFLMAIEWLGERYVLPPGALGPEIAFVYLAIAALFGIAALIRRRLGAG